jgi:hypothetical protein
MWKFLLCLGTLECALTVVGLSQDHGYAGCGKYPFLVFAEPGDPWLEDPAPVSSHYHAPERLTYPGIPLTEKGLREALKNGKPEIRYSAAWYLADQDAKDSIPDIFVALETERVPRAKAYIACALVELGDKRGVQALHRYCGEAEFPVGVKQDVANFLLELHETPCPNAADNPR